MNPSKHDRGPLARAILAIGGIGLLVAVAALAHYVAGIVGGTRGTLAGILVAGAVFCGCRLAHGRRLPGLTRPAPVRLPEPASDMPAPAGSLT